jgi:hypothetical protein
MRCQPRQRFNHLRRVDQPKRRPRRSRQRRAARRIRRDGKRRGASTGRRPTTSCRIVNSTPQVGSYYNQWIDSGRIRVMKMPWWRHPEKGAGAHQVFDERGRPKWVSRGTSPRRSAATRRHGAGSGHGTRLGRRHVLRPRRTEPPPRRARTRTDVDRIARRAHGDYGDEKTRNRPQPRSQVVQVCAERRRHWRFWIPLVDGRPPQHLTYCFGVDISNGANGSNSVITVLRPRD